MRVHDICTHFAVHIAADASIRDAARLMRERHVGAIVVIERHGPKRPVGILTDRDIAISVVAAEVDPSAVTVRDVMTRSVATCTPDQDLADAIRTMRMRGVRRLPVLDPNGDLIGLVAADDIHAAIGEELRDLGRALAIEQARELETRA
jgi:CBS domain-containing protein